MPNLWKQPRPPALLLWVLLGFLLAGSLIILPLGTNQIEMGKLLSLFLVSALAFFLFAAYLTKQPTLHLSAHPLLVVLLGLGFTTLLSIIFAPSHPLAQLLGFGGTWLGFFTIVTLGGWVLEKKGTPYLVATLATMGGISAVMLVLELVGIKMSAAYGFLLGLPFPDGVGFNPAGSAFMVAQLCLLAIVGCLSAARHLPSQKNLFLAGAAINVVGLLLAGWLCLPGKPAHPVILPWAASWSITLDALRNPRTAVLGLGPDNFSTAYTQFKPSWMNTTSWWNVEFTQASTLPFTILSTLGIISFLIWVYFCFVFIKESKKLFSLSPIATAIAATGLLLVWLVPPTTFIMSIWAISLAFLIAETKDDYPTIETPTSLWQKVAHRWPFSRQATTSKVVATVVAATLGLLILVATLQLTRAEFKQFQASQQTLKGNYVQLYELQQGAISLNPYNDAARRSYALTNLAIASAVSNKADLADEDMQKIALLVQQSIREGKAAVVLNPQKAQNWETLGDVYTNFIGAIDGSDTLALEAYRQALFYSPANPNLYIKLGGVFYRQGNYTDAILAFEQAAIQKPNLANAYYNAANAFRELKDYQSAENAYKQTLLVLEQSGGSTSEEYLKANLELEALQQQSATSSATL